MVVGDAVSDIGAVGAVLDFQPAAGVEVVVTWMHDGTNGHDLRDGVTSSSDVVMVDATNQPSPFKFFLNNTRFMRIELVGGQTKAFTGMQTL